MKDNHPPRFIYTDRDTQFATFDPDTRKADGHIYQLVPRVYANRCPEKVIWLTPICSGCLFTLSGDGVPVHREYSGTCRELLGADCPEDSHPYTTPHPEVTTSVSVQSMNDKTDDTVYGVFEYGEYGDDYD